MPNINDWEAAKEVPPSIYKTIGEKGWLAGLMGVHYPRHLVKNAVKSVPPEKWDGFHELIITVCDVFPSQRTRANPGNRTNCLAPAVVVSCGISSVASE